MEVETATQLWEVSYRRHKKQNKKNVKICATPKQDNRGYEAKITNWGLNLYKCLEKRFKDIQHNNCGLLLCSWGSDAMRHEVQKQRFRKHTNILVLFSLKLCSFFTCLIYLHLFGRDTKQQITDKWLVYLLSQSWGNALKKQDTSI